MEELGSILSRVVPSSVMRELTSLRQLDAAATAAADIAAALRGVEMAFEDKSVSATVSAHVQSIAADLEASLKGQADAHAASAQEIGALAAAHRAASQRIHSLEAVKRADDETKGALLQQCKQLSSAVKSALSTLAEAESRVQSATESLKPSPVDSDDAPVPLPALLAAYEAELTRLRSALERGEDGAGQTSTASSSSASALSLVECVKACDAHVEDARAAALLAQSSAEDACRHLSGLVEGVGLGMGMGAEGRASSEDDADSGASVASPSSLLSSLRAEVVAARASRDEAHALAARAEAALQAERLASTALAVATRRSLQLLEGRGAEERQRHASVVADLQTRLARCAEASQQTGETWAAAVEHLRGELAAARAAGEEAAREMVRVRADCASRLAGWERSADIERRAAADRLVALEREHAAIVEGLKAQVQGAGERARAAEEGRQRAEDGAREREAQLESVIEGLKGSVARQAALIETLLGRGAEGEEQGTTGLPAAPAPSPSPSLVEAFARERRLLADAQVAVADASTSPTSATASASASGPLVESLRLSLEAAAAYGQAVQCRRAAGDTDTGSDGEGEGSGSGSDACQCLSCLHASRLSPLATELSSLRTGLDGARERLGALASTTHASLQSALASMTALATAAQETAPQASRSAHMTALSSLAQRVEQLTTQGEADGALRRGLVSALGEREGACAKVAAALMPALEAATAAGTGTAVTQTGTDAATASPNGDATTSDPLSPTASASASASASSTIDRLASAAASKNRGVSTQLTCLASAVVSLREAVTERDALAEREGRLLRDLVSSTGRQVQGLLEAMGEERRTHAQEKDVLRTALLETAVGHAAASAGASGRSPAAASSSPSRTAGWAGLHTAPGAWSVGVGVDGDGDGGDAEGQLGALGTGGTDAGGRGRSPSRGHGQGQQSAGPFQPQVSAAASSSSSLASPLPLPDLRMLRALLARDRLADHGTQPASLSASARMRTSASASVPPSSSSPASVHRHASAALAGAREALLHASSSPHHQFHSPSTASAPAASPSPMHPPDAHPHPYPLPLGSIPVAESVSRIRTQYERLRLASSVLSPDRTPLLPPLTPVTMASGTGAGPGHTAHEPVDGDGALGDLFSPPSVLASASGGYTDVDAFASQLEAEGDAVATGEALALASPPPAATGTGSRAASLSTRSLAHKPHWRYDSGVVTTATATSAAMPPAATAAPSTASSPPAPQAAVVATYRASLGLGMGMGLGTGSDGSSHASLVTLHAPASPNQPTPMPVASAPTTGGSATTSSAAAILSELGWRRPMPVAVSVSAAARSSRSHRDDPHRVPPASPYGSRNVANNEVLGLLNRVLQSTDESGDHHHPHHHHHHDAEADATGFRLGPSVPTAVIDGSIVTPVAATNHGNGRSQVFLQST